MLLAIVTLVSAGWIPLCDICCKQTYKKRIQAEDSAMLLCLQSSDGHALFNDYVKSELSTENLLCYDAIQACRQASKEEDTRTQIQFIYSSFVIVGSLMEVNITQTVREKVKEALNNPLLIADALNILESSVNANLFDTFRRLEKTERYAAFRLASNEKQKMAME